MPTGPLHSIRTHCGHAMDQVGNQQYALRVKTDDGMPGVVYVILCEKCKGKYTDMMLRTHQEIQDWLERRIVPPKDARWWIK